MCVDNIDPCVCIYACSSAETFLPSLKSPGRGDGGRSAGTEGGRSEGHYQEQARAFRHGGERRVLVLRVGVAAFCVLLCVPSAPSWGRLAAGWARLVSSWLCFFILWCFFSSKRLNPSFLPSPPHPHPHLYFILFFLPLESAKT